MNTVVINIKTDPKVKKEAKKIASDLGLTLSGTINGFLKQFIRDKSIFFTLDESNPSDYLLSSIKESEKERKQKQHHSFKNNEESLNFLDKQ